MADINYLPRKIQRAFSRSAVPESVKAMLVLHGNPEYVSYWDDFLGDSAGTWPASANWGYPATVGTGTEAIALTAAEGGVLDVTTSGSSGDTAGQGVGLHWLGDNGVYMAARCKAPTITSFKFEIMMTDSLADDGAVLVKSVPSFTATDCAGFVFDTTDDTNVTFVSNGGSTDGNADATNFTLVADTYFIVEIVIQNNTASGYINGQLVGSGNIEGGNLLSPWLYAEALSASARTLSCDWILCIGPRSA